MPDVPDSLLEQLNATIEAVEHLQEPRFAAVVALARSTADQIDSKIEAVVDWVPNPDAEGEQKPPSGPSDRLLTAYHKLLAELRVTPEALARIPGREESEQPDEFDIFAATERPKLAEDVL
ncbi:terminase small subunit [Gordonia sp. MMO-8]|uniref:terminase small subunit n=1 Tax=Gordonia sp. MMO-8 TaxID=3127886 RepID=UPI00301A1EA0